MTVDYMPEDLSTLDEMGATVHELFQSLVRGGFTEWQACVVVGVVIGACERKG